MLQMLYAFFMLALGMCIRPFKELLQEFFHISIILSKEDLISARLSTSQRNVEKTYVNQTSNNSETNNHSPYNIVLCSEIVSFLIPLYNLFVIFEAQCQNLSENLQK